MQCMSWRSVQSFDIIEFLMCTSLLEDVFDEQLLTNIFWLYPLYRGRQKVLCILLSFNLRVVFQTHALYIYIFVQCCFYLTTYDWIRSFLKITIEEEGTAIYGNLENKINTLLNSIHKNNMQTIDKRAVTKRCRQKITECQWRCLILTSYHYFFSLRTSKKVRQTQFVKKTQLFFQVIDQQHRTKML